MTQPTDKPKMVTPYISQGQFDRVFPETKPTDKFPPLPEHDVEEWSESGITLRYVGWSEEKVKAYAEAVRTAALNEAIEIASKSDTATGTERKLKELRDGK